MLIRSLFLLLLIYQSNLFAQDSTLVTIKTGSSIADVLKQSDIFLYAQFQNGRVFFRDGSQVAARMNYNSLFDQMLFINPQGDTLALTDEKTFKHIAINRDTFYFNKGYIRQLSNNGGLKLAEKAVWQVADIRKVGSHDRPANTFAVTSYSTLTDGFGKTHNLVLSEDLMLRKKPTYFFGNMTNKFVPAAKKYLMGFFYKRQNMLTLYFKENKVNFSNREDLEKLTQFLAQNQ